MTTLLYDDEERVLALLLDCVDGGQLELALAILEAYSPATADHLLLTFRQRVRARLAGSPGARYSRAVEVMGFLNPNGSHRA